MTAALQAGRMDCLCSVKRREGLRRAISVISSLGVVVTALAAIGIFGLISFAVSQRTARSEVDQRSPLLRCNAGARHQILTNDSRGSLRRILFIT